MDKAQPNFTITAYSSYNGTGNLRQVYHTALPLCITVSLWNIVQDVEKAGFSVKMWYPRQDSNLLPSP